VRQTEIKPVRTRGGVGVKKKKTIPGGRDNRWERRAFTFVWKLAVSKRAPWKGGSCTKATCAKGNAVKGRTGDFVSSAAKKSGVGFFGGAKPTFRKRAECRGGERKGLGATFEECVGGKRQGVKTGSEHQIPVAWGGGRHSGQKQKKGETQTVREKNKENWGVLTGGGSP